MAFERDNLGDLGKFGLSKIFKKVLRADKKILKRGISRPLTKFYKRAIKPGVKMLIPGGVPPPMPSDMEVPLREEAPVQSGEVKAASYMKYYVIGGVAMAGLLTVLLFTGKKKEGGK